MRGVSASESRRSGGKLESGAGDVPPCVLRKEFVVEFHVHPTLSHLGRLVGKAVAGCDLTSAVFGDNSLTERNMREIHRVGAHA